MSFRTRFILLALFNILLVMAGLWLSARYKVNLSQRLIDLHLEDPKSLNILFGFIGGALVNFLGNFALLISRKSEFTYEQVAALLQAGKRA